MRDSMRGQARSARNWRLSLKSNTRNSKIWCYRFEKMAVFCRKFVQKVPNIAFFGTLSANLPSFGSFIAKIQKIE